MQETQTSPVDLLTELSESGVSQEERRNYVLEAEVMQFDAEQRNTLAPLLRQYIEQNRDSDDPAVLIAVASAIRKYVAILNPEEIASLGFVLDSSHQAPLAPEIELEVCKMLVRKLCVLPRQDANQLAELSDQLLDLARTYLNPRLLPRQYHGAIALNSILALTLLGASCLPEVVERLQRLQVRWFHELLVRRTETMLQDLSEHPQLRGNLESLIVAIHEEANV